MHKLLAAILIALSAIAFVDVALCITTFLVAASAETPAAISKARQARALAKWLLAEIAKVRSTPGFTAQQARDDTREIQNTGFSTGEDMQAIAAFIVLQAATNDMDDDIKQILCADSPC
jgi:phage-related minor tail protein